MMELIIVVFIVSFFIISTFAYKIGYEDGKRKKKELFMQGLREGADEDRKIALEWSVTDADGLDDE